MEYETRTQPHLHLFAADGGAQANGEFSRSHIGCLITGILLIQKPHLHVFAAEGGAQADGDALANEGEAAQLQVLRHRM